MAWGWRVPFLFSAFAVAAGYVIRRRVAETPCSPSSARAERWRERLSSRPSPTVAADMLRVTCMALMNVIPVVTTIFGAAYAVQPGYGIEMREDVYLWIPVLGNCLAVLVIPFVGRLSDRIGRRPPIVAGSLAAGLLSFVYLYAISIGHVPLAIVVSLVMWGVRLPGLQRRLPELLPGAVPRAHPGYRDGDRAEPRHDGDGAAARALRRRCAAGLDRTSR